MHKGFFTQGVVVLTKQPFADATIDAALAEFDVRKRTAAEGQKNWMSGYPSWTIAMRPDVNGAVIVDVVDAPWPDGMGDPQSGEKELFAAWSMGFMGPHTWPGCLARAIQWTRGYSGKQTALKARNHGAFVRIRSSYIMGAGDNAPVFPDDYAPREELDFVNNVALAIARADKSSCYFNPGGETLFTATDADARIAEMRIAEIPPLDLWSSVRMVRMDDAKPWMLADTVGMEQVNAQDHEACFQEGVHDPAEIASFLRGTTYYVMDSGAEIKTGHTTDGPGGVWRSMEIEESVMPAPRQVIRWYPDRAKLPEALRGKSKAEESIEKPGLFGRLKRLFS